MKEIAISIIFLLTFSVKSQSECPEENSIAPCLCYRIEDRPNIKCSDINDEDELEDIFSGDFPDPAVNSLTIDNSFLERLTRNVFGNVTFDEVYITLDYLEEITEDVFENSVGTLRNLEVLDSPVSQKTFPFSSLSRYTRLDQLTLKNNKLSEFPGEIASESLSLLFIGENNFMDVPSDAIATMANLTGLYLEECGIETLANTAFRGSRQLLYLSLKDNKISTIHARVFAYLPYLIELDLSGNQMSDIQKGALAYMPSLVKVELAFNNIKKIDFMTSGNYQLNYFSCLKNNINYIKPGTFSFLPMLDMLDLGYNNLTSLVNKPLQDVKLTSGILFLDYNYIDYFDENAFGGVVKSRVNVRYNTLDSLNESWLKPLLDNQNTVSVGGNPITCGCEISWLFQDPTYQYQQVVGRCPNGTYIIDLNPIWYQENC